MELPFIEGGPPPMELPFTEGGPPPMELPFIEGGPPPMELPFTEGGPPPMELPFIEGGPPLPALPFEEGGPPIPALPVEVDGLPLLALTTMVETPWKLDQVKEICRKPAKTTNQNISGMMQMRPFTEHKIWSRLSRHLPVHVIGSPCPRQRYSAQGTAPKARGWPMSREMCWPRVRETCYSL